MKGKRDSQGHEDSLRALLKVQDPAKRHKPSEDELSESATTLTHTHTLSLFLPPFLPNVVDENLSDSTRSHVSRVTVSPYRHHFSSGNSRKVSL